MAETTIQNKSFQLTSFSGVDMKMFAKFPKGDGTGTVTVELGTLSAISGVIKTQVKPRVAIGYEEPIGLSTGMRLISGNLRFEVIDQSFINSMRNVSLNTNLTEATAKSMFIYNGQEIMYADQLPPMDIIVTAVSEIDKTKRAMRVIRGVVLTSQGSAIGLDSLTIQESYEFIARKIEPLDKVETDGTIKTGGAE